MLGARVQRSPILDLQQPPSPSTGEVWPGHQGELPGLWGRVHQDNCTEWSPLAPKVQAEETAFDELVMRKTLKGEAKTKKKKGTKDREKKIHTNDQSRDVGLHDTRDTLPIVLRLFRRPNRFATLRTI